MQDSITNWYIRPLSAWRQDELTSIRQDYSSTSVLGHMAACPLVWVWGGTPCPEGKSMCTLLKREREVGGRRGRRQEEQQRVSSGGDVEATSVKGSKSCVSFCINCRQSWTGASPPLPFCPLFIPPLSSSLYGHKMASWGLHRRQKRWCKGPPEKSTDTHKQTNKKIIKLTLF